MTKNITKFGLISKIITIVILFSSLGLAKADLPQDLPIPIVEKIDNPYPWSIYLSPFGPSAQQGGQYKNYFIILDSALNISNYKLVPGQENGYIGYHFKSEPNGNLSYLTRKLDGTISLVDTNFNILRSYKDTFSLYNRIKYYAHYDLLPNGNTQLVLYNFQYVDMSKYFAQGEPNGAVLQALIQELDKDNNVVFQWKSLDYFPVNLTQDPLAPNIDYFHPNSMVMDNDGNLLISARDLNSIIKINRNSGEVMWNLGGKKNDFTFINENETNAPNYFSYQHDIRILPNGNITIFDNGRQHNPQYSRAVEYQLDEVNKTCKKVWEYRHEPDFFADQHGSTQRMPNGNTLIAWGTYSMDGNTSVTEVRPDNTIALEFKYPTGLESQFIYKYPWPVCPLIASVEKSELLELNTYNFNSNGQNTGLIIKFNKLNAFVYNRIKVQKFDCSPLNPSFDGRPPIVYPYRFLFSGYDFSSLSAELNISLNNFPLVVNINKAVVYFRPKEGEGTFIPLETIYNSNDNSLTAIADTTGEFIIGFKDIPLIPPAPITYTPENGSFPNDQKPIQFDWCPKGYFTDNQIQVAGDTTFTQILIDSTLRQLTLKTNKLISGNEYYWRVRSTNEAGFSNWSGINSFTLTGPFISMNIPNGGETWDTTAHIIRWNCNLKDSVDQFFKIELLRNGELVSAIQPSRFSAINAYKWKIPATSVEDSTYQIRITSVKNPSITGISSGFFKITNTTVNVKENENNLLNIEHYPNPVNDIVVFNFNINSESNVRIELFDVFGNKLNEIYSQYLSPGNYNYRWDMSNMQTGIYFYQLSAGDYFKVNKLEIVR